MSEKPKLKPNKKYCIIQTAYTFNTIVTKKQHEAENYYLCHIVQNLPSSINSIPQNSRK